MKNQSTTAKKQTWREANYDKSIAWEREYRAQNKEKLDAYRKAWVEKNRARDRELKARYREKNKDKIVQYQRKYYADRREQIAFRAKQKKYGVTKAMFLSMIADQSGLCALCGKSLPEKHRGIAVDHDHNNGQVRGLLHTGCNVGLGFYERYAAKCAAYLSRSKMKIAG